MSVLPRVPYDTELVEGLAAFKANFEFEPLVPDTIRSYRERFRANETSIADLVGDRPVYVDDRVVPGPPGEPDITVMVVRPSREPVGAGIYAIHGGGMILGHRAGAAADLINYAAEFGVVGVSVEYRLAPESPHPAPVEDCYAGLVWMADHADELGVDPRRILVQGASAGGGLCAAVALLARDRGGPALAGQALYCPMLDDRNNSVSSRQYADTGVWDGSFNETGWNALLGTDVRGGPHVSPYAAPSRAEDLGNLPPTFVDVGAAEVFRDESVDYASRVWTCGGQAELHVWAGGFHGFNGIVPGAQVSQAANETRRQWLIRTMDL